MKKFIIKIMFLIISGLIMILQPQPIRGTNGYNYFLWVQFLIILVLLLISISFDYKTYKNEKEKTKKMIKEIKDGTIKFGYEERKIYDEFKKDTLKILEAHNMKNIYLCGSEIDVFKKIMLNENIKICAQINKDKKYRDLYFLVKNTKNGPVIVDEDVFTNPDKYSKFYELSKEPAVQASGITIYDCDAEPDNYRNELSELLRSPQSWCWHVDKHVQDELDEQRKQDEQQREEIYRRERELEEEEYYAKLQAETDEWWDENIYHR